MFVFRKNLWRKTTVGKNVQNVELELSDSVLSNVKPNRKVSFSPFFFSFGNYFPKLPMGWKWAINSRVSNGIVPGLPATGVGKEMALLLLPSYF